MELTIVGYGAFTATAEIGAQTNMPRANVLVVDDEQDILELVEYNLSKEGY